MSTPDLALLFEADRIARESADEEHFETARCCICGAQPVTLCTSAGGPCSDYCDDHGPDDEEAA